MRTPPVRVIQNFKWPTMLYLALVKEYGTYISYHEVVTLVHVVAYIPS
jgi:hypothetical protein